LTAGTLQQEEFRTSHDGAASDVAIANENEDGEFFAELPTSITW